MLLRKVPFGLKLVWKYNLDVLSNLAWNNPPHEISSTLMIRVGSLVLSVVVLSVVVPSVVALSVVVIINVVWQQRPSVSSVALACVQSDWSGRLQSPPPQSSSGTVLRRRGWQPQPFFLTPRRVRTPP